MKHYVVGFAFDERRRTVVLIRKNRPNWQAGKWNGVGGKVEAGESVIDAMVREFFEETGVMTRVDEWTPFGTLTGPQSIVTLFKLFDDHVVASVKTMTDEQVIQHTPLVLDLLAESGVPNLAWLVSVAKSQENPFILATYPDTLVVANVA
jgi:8-oxo-dGTP diphosphatase